MRVLAEMGVDAMESRVQLSELLRWLRPHKLLVCLAFDGRCLRVARDVLDEAKSVCLRGQVGLNGLDDRNNGVLVWSLDELSLRILRLSEYGVDVHLITVILRHHFCLQSRIVAVKLALHSIEGTNQANFPQRKRVRMFHSVTDVALLRVHHQLADLAQFGLGNNRHVSVVFLIVESQKCLHRFWENS